MAEKRARRRPPLLILSCEHGGNRVPTAYREAFAGARAALATHRGLDIGALAVARALSRRFMAPLEYATVTRLLIDLNRSPGHPRLFSEWSSGFSAAERQRIVERYYEPYRRAVERRIRDALARGRRVVHVSVHSFTPELDGHVRRAEIGLLYDPRRPLDVRGADAMHELLKERGFGYRVRRNYPYTGVSDGFQPYLRRRLPARRYAALELEMNQGVVATAAGRRAMIAAVGEALQRLLDTL